jgi:hypothetical protein
MARKRVVREVEEVRSDAPMEREFETEAGRDEFYEAIPYEARQDRALYGAGAYDEATDREASWISSVLMLAGVWLILAPYLLGYVSQEAATSDILSGIAVGVLASIGALAATRSRATAWLSLAVGVWLLLAPFVLGYTAEQTPFWNDIIMGAVVIALSIWRLAARDDEVVE